MGTDMLRTALLVMACLFNFQFDHLKVDAFCEGPPVVIRAGGVVVTPLKGNYTTYERVELSCEDPLAVPYGDYSYSYCDPSGRWHPDVSNFGCYSDAYCLGPPTVNDPYGVIITPRKDNYTAYDMVTLSCADGLTPTGNDYTYCYPADIWKPEVAGFRCAERVTRKATTITTSSTTTITTPGTTLSQTPSDASSTGTTMLPSPTPFTPDHSLVSSECMHCLWAVVSHCRIPNPKCKLNEEGVLVCGPYQLSEVYWKAARLGGADVGSDWKACSSTFECSELAVQSYMSLFANDCRLGHEPTCEDITRMHYGGPDKFESPEAAELWTHVELCLNPYGPE